MNTHLYKPIIKLDSYLISLHNVRWRFIFNANLWAQLKGENMNHRKLNLRRIIPAVLITIALATSSAYAGGLFGGGHHREGGMMKVIERMIDHVDLSDDQEEEAKVILDNAREYTKNMSEIRHRFFKQIIENNPDDTTYLSIAEEQAEAIAAEVKNKILHMAKIRQEVYKILTTEQKEKLADHIEKKMARMKNNVNKYKH